MINMEVESYNEVSKKRTQRYIKHVLEDDNLSKKQLEVLKKYNEYYILNSDSLYTRYNYLQGIRKAFLNIKKEPDSITKEDIEQYLISCKDLAKSTRLNTQFHLLFFFRWIGKPEVVDWIKLKRSKKTKLPEDILSPKEVLKLIQVCDNDRNRALISGLYSSACRRGEWLSLRIKDLTFDEYGCRVRVDGKTGMRQLRLINGSGAIKRWIESHPDKDNPEAPVWINISTHKRRKNKPKCMTGSGLNSLLGSLADRAGIKKKLYAHLLRHSRLTELAKTLSESELKVFAGWTGDSNMARVYVHLSASDVEEKLLRSAGLIKAEARDKDILQNIICEKCNKTNNPENKWCDYCNYPISIEALRELKEREKEQLEMMQKVNTLSDFFKRPETEALLKLASKLLLLQEKARG